MVPSADSASNVVDHLRARRLKLSRCLFLAKIITYCFPVQFSRCESKSRPPGRTRSPILQNDTELIEERTINFIFCRTHVFRLLFLTSASAFASPDARPRNPNRSRGSCLPRKEVIQPHLPIRLPCYDFTPVIGLTFGGCSLRWLTDFGYSQLPWCDGRCVQGPGTYSPRHSDSRLLATPTSCGRVAAHSPN